MRRRDFLPNEQWGSELLDEPLPIGFGQTTSQPSLILQMIDLLALKPGARVLEIGTGSGFQTALLAERCAEVYSVEIIGALADAAAARLDALGITNVHLRTGDGWLGWPEAAPFDGIVVSASVPRVPPALLRQLADGGRLVVPVGTSLEVVTRRGKELHQRSVTGVRFVPCTGPFAEAERL